VAECALSQPSRDEHYSFEHLRLAELFDSPVCGAAAVEARQSVRGVGQSVHGGVRQQCGAHQQQLFARLSRLAQVAARGGERLVSE
jgi:hypothetical protein